VRGGASRPRVRGLDDPPCRARGVLRARGAGARAAPGSFRAFVHGRRARNLYHVGFPDGALGEVTVGVLRQRLGWRWERTPARAGDVAGFVAWWAAAIVWHGTLVALVALTALALWPTLGPRAGRGVRRALRGAAPFRRPSRGALQAAHRPQGAAAPVTQHARSRVALSTPLLMIAAIGRDSASNGSPACRFRGGGRQLPPCAARPHEPVTRYPRRDWRLRRAALLRRPPAEVVVGRGRPLMRCTVSHRRESGPLMRDEPGY
jgi:hypothetical protein